MSTASRAVGGAPLPDRAPALRIADGTGAHRAVDAVDARGRAARIASVDVFRGLVIAGMLVVNNLVWTSSTPRQLMHAPWGQGVTFTDMILPWFVFILGVAIPLSARVDRSRLARALRVARRAVLLVVLGIAIDTVEYHGVTVGMDVLQLLGLSYLAAVLLARTPVWTRLAVGAALLAGYGVLLMRVPAPGYAPGVFDARHNIVQYLNDAYLVRYDLAGVLAVAPAAALALLGTAAGTLLRAAAVSERVKIAVFAAVGAALTYAGLWWGHALPLSKDLWTPSYTVAAGGLGLLGLAGCHLLCGSARLRPLGFPFAVLGANAIVGYVASAVVAITLIEYTWRDPWSPNRILSLHTTLLDPLGRAVGTAAAGWLYTAAVVVWWWLVLWVLYRRRVFIRV